LSTNTSPPVESMADLLEEADQIKVVRRGQIVQGMMMRIDQEGILVSIGHKSEGLVPPREMRSLRAEDISSLRVGDEILTRVLVTENEEGSLILSLDQAREEMGWRTVERSFSAGEGVEGVITGHNRGGVLVDVDGLSGFIPISHIGGFHRGASDEEADLEHRIGESLHLKVIEVDRARKRAIFSEKIAIQEQRESQKEHVLQELQEGEVRKGKVTSVCNFGAFVDLGGADGLIHISELSWEPVQSTEQVVGVGDEVEVYVMKVDQEARRIALSLRRMSPEPWDTLTERYQVNQLVTGTITKLTHFGAFARIEGSVEGLIHISELSHRAINHPKEVVREGDVLTLKILNIEPERKRLALSIRQAEEF
jgi:small subunit ribosomal protein S1